MISGSCESLICNGEGPVAGKDLRRNAASEHGHHFMSLAQNVLRDKHITLPEEKTPR